MNVTAFYDKDGNIQICDHLSKPFVAFATGPGPVLRRFLQKFCSTSRGRHLHIPNNDPDYFLLFLKGQAPEEVKILR